MGWPTVTVGSQWNYNRSLDNSTKTKNLIVMDINDRGVKFDEKMAFDRYGLDFFDGDVFYPVEWTQRYNMNQHHCPVRDYDTSWDWLIPVVKKIKVMPIQEFQKKKPVMNAVLDLDIEGIYKAVVEFIKWYNAQTSTAYTSDNISTYSDIDKVK